ncbi:MAG TPA: UPF0175 family protein [Candidatus Methylomirabilis sp.]|nr:UPF0175 family protein [Candidatus Methylomirabilis sp.]
MAAVRIELPDDIEKQLQKQWGDLPRHVLESLAVEGYRARVLSRSQVRRMLGFETGAEVDEFMKRAGVPFDYTVEDFQNDESTSRVARMEAEKRGALKPAATEVQAKRRERSFATLRMTRGGDRRMLRIDSD